MVEPGQDAQKLDSALLCGDIDIRIAADGTWFHEGGPIGRKELVKLFASVLERDEAGDYWLVTPVERARIRVDDAPFVAVALDVTGKGRDQCLTFRTNIDAEVMADSAHPLEFRPRPGGEPAPYLSLGGGLYALAARAVYYQLVELGVTQIRDGESQFGVWSAGSFFSFGAAPADAN
ncbi:MAG: DUF1285 domain-containing protein [Alphaproteobacteria bacterium]|jgi:hypothetical protein|nr:DUF1285 domain-containing protein [Alphaproteobacteria bacterium]MDP6590669.1 DUF1285 domain-containing protein [Alphaproteobacteria bacterium]